MVGFRAGSSAQIAFLGELFAHGLLIDSGVPGLYGHGSVFDDVITAVDQWVARAGAGENAERLRFPPLLSRHQLESNGYLESFPHLVGSVFAFEGDASQALEQADRASRHQDWSEFQEMTELTLTPAACLPAYPAIAARGLLPAGGLTLDLGGSWVFRHEPSSDPTRMQSFHMREMVRMGEPETVTEWRNFWRDRSSILLGEIGLEVQALVASDPFFGRTGRMLAASQRQQELKFELLVRIADQEPTAVASFNYHHDHFSARHGIRTHDDTAAHTACFGFGLERIALALVHAHGFDPGSWPEAVRRELWSQ